MIQRQGNRRPRRGNRRQGQKEGRQGHGRMRGRAKENPDQDFWIPYEQSYRCADFQTLTQIGNKKLNPSPYKLNDTVIISLPDYAAEKLKLSTTFN
eukprot:TRINITY_DN7246_c0_g1_i2.p1 TRINITY_DN7246_c0_g1~~TRINITY_DN7246_c0_g1_i2.p1  ORF type:complete len:96 (-),score=14.18 TRINITY_DN7246_c0_g1_i2:25-312(-)